MTTPSRRHEILKRRARKSKVAILRRRYKNGTEMEQGQILGKLARLSPTMTLEQFTRGEQS
jgi:hypothetical protein